MRDSAATIDYGPATSTALTFNGGKTYLPLPYGQLTFTGGQPDPTTDFLLNPETRRMQTTDQARFQRLDIQVQPKQISAAQLAAATSSRQKVASRYLQLPRTLPKRIRTLAKRITAKATTHTKRYWLSKIISNQIHASRIQKPMHAAPRQPGTMWIIFFLIRPSVTVITSPRQWLYYVAVSACQRAGLRDSTLAHCSWFRKSEKIRDSQQQCPFIAGSLLR